MALALGACGGGTPEARPQAPASRESPGKGEAGTASAPGKTAQAPLDANAIAKRLETVVGIGGILTASGTCSLLALHHTRFKGPRDMLYMLVNLYPKNVGGPEPVCKVDIFSPTDEPRLQWHLSVAAAGKDGKLESKRTRPDKYRPPTEAEQLRLDAVLRAASAARPRGFTVPVAIRAGAGWLVYLMDYSLEENTLSLGPHYRVVVPANGAPKAELLSTGKVVNLALLDGGKSAIELEDDKDLPNEAHVFMSALSKRTLTIKTPNASWSVRRDEITRIE